MTNHSTVDSFGQAIDIRADIATLLEVGWNDYLDETHSNWRSETPTDFSLPIPARACELIAERIMTSYDMQEAAA